MNREQGCFYCFDSFIYTVIAEVIVKLFCDGVHFNVPPSVSYLFYCMPSCCRTDNFYSALHIFVLFEMWLLNICIYF